MAYGAFSLYIKRAFLVWVRTNSNNKRVKVGYLNIKRETCVFRSLDSLTIPLCAENRVLCDTLCLIPVLLCSTSCHFYFASILAGKRELHALLNCFPDAM